MHHSQIELDSETHISTSWNLIEIDFFPGRPSPFFNGSYHQAAVGLLGAVWAAGTKERDLEKVALQHVKDETKAAERAAKAEVVLVQLPTELSFSNVCFLYCRLRLDSQHLQHPIFDCSFACPDAARVLFG